jgi:hypothetical protein
MEMARGARPELFADAGKKDGKERWPINSQTISMLKLMLPKDKRDAQAESKNTGLSADHPASQPQNIGTPGHRPPSP